MAIKNYTTNVDMRRTVSEIQGILGEKGAKFVAIEYSEGGTPVAVKFGLEINGVPIPFRLPCNVEGVYRALNRNRGRSRYNRSAEKIDRERAPHVAWRIVKNWVEAQMALVEAEQAKLAEVFLPYTVDTNGRTMFEWFVEERCKQLTTGEVSQ